MSSYPIDCANVEGGAQDGVISVKFVVGTRDEELVSEDDGKDICLLVMHKGNSNSDVLTWSSMDDEEVIGLTSPRSYDFSRALTGKLEANSSVSVSSEESSVSVEESISVSTEEFVSVSVEESEASKDILSVSMTGEALSLT